MKSYQELETENQNLMEDITTLEKWNTEAEDKIVDLKKIQGAINSKTPSIKITQIFIGYIIASSLVTTTLLVKPLLTGHVGWLDSHFNLDLPKCINN